MQLLSSFLYHNIGTIQQVGPCFFYMKVNGGASHQNMSLSTDTRNETKKKIIRKIEKRILCKNNLLTCKFL